jgi:hypothetical protein
VLPCGSIFHVEPFVEERSERSCPALPVSVNVPAIVCVVPVANVSVRAVVTDFVRLWKVVEPDIVWLVPSKTTVPEFRVNTPLVRLKLPANEIVVGADSVPEVSVRLPLISKLLADVNVSELPSVALMIRWW